MSGKMLEVYDGFRIDPKFLPVLPARQREKFAKDSFEYVDADGNVKPTGEMALSQEHDR
jgi:hypothetical protein